MSYKGFLRNTTAVLAAAGAATVLAAPVVAQEAFYKGKTVTIITSTGAGGTYDTVARAIARHMPRHLAGAPTMIVQNMPGGGNVLATNHMYNVAPKDGTVIATLHNAMPTHQVLDGRGVRFDARRFNWLGSTGPENSAIITWHTTGVTTFRQFREQEVIVGGTGAGSGIVIFPTVMNNVLGTKFRIVIGYKSSDEVNVAMERGEVQARSSGLGSLFSHNYDWVTGKKVNFVAQVGARRDKRIADVPLLQEFAETEEQKQILLLISAPTALGKPYTAPPDVPTERVAALRAAFMATLNDATLLGEMNKLNIEIEPMTGEEVTQIVMDTVNASPAAIEKARAALPQAEKKDSKKDPKGN